MSFLASSSRRRRSVIKNPEMTKKILTPRGPRRPTIRWLATTKEIEIARRPSKDGIRCGRRNSRKYCSRRSCFSFLNLLHPTCHGDGSGAQADFYSFSLPACPCGMLTSLATSYGKLSVLPAILAGTAPTRLSHPRIGNLQWAVALPVFLPPWRNPRAFIRLLFFLPALLVNS